MRQRNSFSKRIENQLLTLLQKGGNPLQHPSVKMTILGQIKGRCMVRNKQTGMVTTVR